MHKSQLPQINGQLISIAVYWFFVYMMPAQNVGKKNLALHGNCGVQRFSHDDALGFIGILTV